MTEVDKAREVAVLKEVFPETRARSGMHPRRRGDVREFTRIVEHPDAKLEECKVQVAHTLVGELVVLDFLVELAEIVNTDIGRVADDIVHLAVVVMDGEGVGHSDIPFNIRNAIHRGCLVQPAFQLAEVSLVEFDGVDIGFEGVLQPVLGAVVTDMLDAISGNGGNDDVAIACAVVYEMLFEDIFGSRVLRHIKEDVHDVQWCKNLSFFFQCVVNHNFIPTFSSTIALAEL